MFTRILAVAVGALLGVGGLALGIAVGAFLGVAGMASGNGHKPTKLTSGREHYEMVVGSFSSSSHMLVYH